MVKVQLGEAYTENKGYFWKRSNDTFHGIYCEVTPSGHIVSVFACGFLEWLAPKDIPSYDSCILAIVFDLEREQLRVREISHSALTEVVSSWKERLYLLGERLCDREAILQYVKSGEAKQDCAVVDSRLRRAADRTDCVAFTWLPPVKHTELD
jgi:hypothetical protein